MVNKPIERSYWIRNRVKPPSNILLVEANEISNKQGAYHKLLSTAAPTRDTVIAIQCCITDDSWLKEIADTDSNISFIDIEIDQGGDWQDNVISYLNDSFSTLSKNALPVVFVDNIAPLVTTNNTVQYDFLKNIVTKLANKSAIGFFRFPFFLQNVKVDSSFYSLFTHVATTNDGIYWEVNEMNNE